MTREQIIEGMKSLLEEEYKEYVQACKIWTTEPKNPGVDAIYRLGRVEMLGEVIRKLESNEKKR